MAGDDDRIHDYVFNGEQGGCEVHLFICNDMSDSIIKEVEGGHKLLPIHRGDLFSLDEEAE